MQPKVENLSLTIRKSKIPKHAGCFVKVWEKHFPLTDVKLKHRKDGPAYIGVMELTWYENGILQKEELKPEYAFLLHET
jgi:hypothetical protein